MRASTVYVAGYGRSGSTLLDMILSSMDGFWGGGELCWLFAEYLRNGDCSCGRPIRDCPFWTDVFGVLERDPEMCSVSQAATTTVKAQSIRISPDPSLDEDYRAIWRQTFRAIRLVSGASVIVDSSKSARRSFRRRILLREAGEEVAVIHLVRHPRDVMRSVRSGSNRKLERGEPAMLFGGGWRGLAGWVVTNGFVELTRASSEVHLRVRYEDLVGNPVSTVRSIARFVDADPGRAIDILESNAPLDAGHAIAGNRMRRAGTTNIRPDGGREERSRAPSLMSKVVPLMKKYGYS